MVSYTNETKVRDIPGPSLELEVRELLKGAIFDFGAEMKKEVFEHSVKRLAYIISAKYKGFMLGEVKFIFEGMTEFIKGKLSVSTIMQLFYKYSEEKIERQRREVDDKEIENMKNFVNCTNSAIGKALIYKLQLVETRQISINDWDKYPLKQVTADIESGKIKYFFIPIKKERKIYDNQ